MDRLRGIVAGVFARRVSQCPFDGVDPLRAAVALIDGVLELYGPDGASWTQNHLDDGEEHHCLVGAMRIVRKERGIRRDQLGRFVTKIQRRANHEPQV